MRKLSLILITTSALFACASNPVEDTQTADDDRSTVRVSTREFENGVVEVYRNDAFIGKALENGFMNDWRAQCRIPNYNTEDRRFSDRIETIEFVVNTCR